MKNNRETPPPVTRVGEGAQSVLNAKSIDRAVASRFDIKRDVSEETVREILTFARIRQSGPVVMSSGNFDFPNPVVAHNLFTIARLMGSDYTLSEDVKQQSLVQIRESLLQRQAQGLNFIEPIIEQLAAFKLLSGFDGEDFIPEEIKFPWNSITDPAVYLGTMSILYPKEEVEAFAATANTNMKSWRGMALYMARRHLEDLQDARGSSNPLMFRQVRGLAWARLALGEEAWAKEIQLEPVDWETIKASQEKSKELGEIYIHMFAYYATILRAHKAFISEDRKLEIVLSTEAAVEKGGLPVLLEA